MREKILALQQENPQLSHSAIAKQLGIHHSTVDYHLNEKRRKDVDRLRKSRRKTFKLILVQEFGGKCCICGYSKSVQALQFHHLDSEKKEFGLSAASNRSLNALREEAKKCILLCANCHIELHEKERCEKLGS